ncbi:YigZ family protein [Bacillus marinisedimentorum]|uniref:YigZ family protein n=1 Tax=Bacillus marinisedimentorum TaxID=1821260 RepID=UPI0007DF2ACA|nr:YigZ family protein [Bacillus marinisedimentorum]
MLSTYYTVKGYGEHEINIQKSRFIGYVKRTETEEEAQAFIQEIKKKNWNANHNCSAYMIGEHDLLQKANDDGEPSGTAGVPMLEVLKKRELKDTTVVVTRYFGGIKLGSGGLIRAYGKSASEVINKAGIIEMKLMQVMELTIDYTLLGKLENDLRTSKFILKKVEYLEKVKIQVYIQSGEENLFTFWVDEHTNGLADVKKRQTKYLEFDV